ncbi:phage head completion protein [Agrobacterium salinitolerans]|uniref:Head-tail adaptor protein n=1 Tax=Agrobacterium salinitolerans TaxID=1183413 RepID=A0ABY3BRB9_9HYPH|nr:MULTISPECIES: head-tail adaptor protein [Agrobacterium]MCZ7493240.1 head-tail adaptor protein [Rhizobium rhizogenes]MCZ7893372.1 head-tail adaptor protein [Agrobacterium salinitolerans]TRA93859.1 head-tail adaptor protein [Agrobacterium salinitolerans]
MTGGGDLRGTFEFRRKTDGNDGFGGVIPGAGPVATIFTTSGRINVRSGDEMVLNNVPRGVSTVEITVRQQPAIKAVNTTWSIRDKHSGRSYNVKMMKPDQKGAFITFTAEGGTP